MAKKNAERLVLWITPHSLKHQDMGDRSTSFHLQILRVDPSDNKPRNCSRGYEQELRMFADLKLSCHLSWWDRNDDNRFQSNFWGPRYDGYMILDSEADVKAIHDGWKRCAKARAAFPVEPASFGQYCALMCAGLGVKEYAIETRHGGTFYSDGDWEYGPISRAAALVDAEIEKIRKHVMPERETLAEAV